MSSPFFETEFSRKIKTYMWNGIDVDFSREAEQIELPDDAEQQLPAEPLAPGEEAGASTLYDPANWNSMQHYYPLNEDFTDSVGSLDLSAVNSPSFVSAVDGQGISFNGTDQHLENTSFTFNPTSEVSIVGWVNVNTVPSGAEAPIAGTFPSGGGSPDFALGVDENNSVSVVVDAGGTVVTSVGGSYSTGTKLFVAMTYDGTSLDAYLNGSTPVASTSASGDITNDNDYFWIGQQPNGPTYLDANYVDEVALFNKGLSDSEIDTLYQKGV